jgi:outer membrane lipoprotein LolB
VIRLSALRLPAVLALLLLLAACVSRPPVYTNPTLPAHWEAEGKAAVRAGDRGSNVYFTWTQTGEHYHIIVRGPLGLGRAELQGQPGLVTLSADNLPQDVSASSLEELLEKTTQRQAPVSHALHWMKAEPATAQARLSRGPDGKLLQIQEQGWTIDYLEWSTEAPNLPRRLTVSGPDGRATIVIGLWRLIPDASPSVPAMEQAL